MIPLRDNVPRVSAPVAVSVIIAINVVAFLYSKTLDNRGLLYLYHLFGVVPARFFNPEWATWAGYPDTIGWPFISYMFLHGGWFHIVANMWMLWIFGDNIEDVTGHRRFVVFYLLCGLAAVAMHMAFEPGETVPIVGASGAVAGIMGAYVVLYPHGQVVAIVPIIIVPLVMRFPSYIFLGVWFLSQFIAGVISEVRSSSDIAWWAHVGGFMAGVYFIRYFKRPGHCKYCYNPATKDYDPEDTESRS